MPIGDPVEQFLHDVPPAVAAEAAAHASRQAPRPMREPYPLAALPDVPTVAIVSRHDRFFPLEWQRSLVRARRGIEPVEIDGGHTPALSRPAELAELLLELPFRPAKPDDVQAAPR